MISFLERNFTNLVTMTSFIYCILGLVLIFFKSPKTDVYEIEQNGVVTGYPRIFAGPQTIKGGKPDPDVYARHPHTSG